MKRRIGILTSGGDCPGLNAAIRGVARAAYEMFDAEIIGIHDGYRGLIQGDYQLMERSQFSGILTLGGTILGTSRQPFRNMKVIGDDNVDKVAAMKANYKAMKLDCLVILGGNGTHKTANLLSQEGLNVIGLPKTIDNDLYGTDFTIGYDTALNTIVECVDKIRDTATSHDRIFFVEVMGRDAGFLAQNSAIASGAEAAIIPEDKTDVDQLEIFIGRGFRKTKNSSIVIVTESPQNKNGGAMYYADRVKKEYPEYDVRVSILGHLQRGGAPSANDRILASRLGEAAIQALMEDQQNVMIGIRNNEIVYVPFAQAIKNDKPIDKSLIRVLNELSI